MKTRFGYGLSTTAVVTAFLFITPACGDGSAIVGPGDVEADTVPDTSVPDTLVPDADDPDTVDPDTVEPDTFVPPDSVITDVSDVTDTTDTSVADTEVVTDPCDPNPCTEPPDGCVGTVLETFVSPGACTVDAGAAVCTYDLDDSVDCADTDEECSDTALACVPVGLALAVVDTTPADLAVDVDVDTTVSITFNQAMDAATVTAQNAAGPCTGNVQLSFDDFATCVGFTAETATLTEGGTVATLVPAPALTLGLAYTLRVTTDATSGSGATLDAPHDITFATGAPDVCGGSPVLISQVYGGGGNSGSVFNNDFVELHNRTNAPVTLNGYSLQYTSASGTSWGATDNQLVRLDGVIAPGGYFLVQLAAGSGDPGPLPTPDQIGTINMGGSGGKVALVIGDAPLPAEVCPDPARTLDFAPFGASATSTCGDMGANAAIGNSTALHRAIAGCLDTGVAAADFVVATPRPRTSATTPAFCACPDDAVANETDAATEADYCNLQWPPTIDVGHDGTIPDIYGQLFEAGLTDTTTGGPAAGVIAQVGFGVLDADPLDQDAWAFFAATFNAEQGNNDEYQGTFELPITAPPAIATFAYTYRFSLDGGASWTWCDKNGAGSNPDLTFEPGELGLLTIGADACNPNPCEDPPVASCDGDVVQTFTSPGACTIVEGAASCAYTPTAGADCADTGERCLAGACVACVDDVDCDFPFEVCDDTDNTCMTECTDDAFEGNQTLATAEVLTEDLVATDLVICPDTSDFFAVTLAEGDVITAVLSFIHVDGDLDLFLVGPDGNDVAVSATTADVETVQHTVLAGEAGVYTLEVWDDTGDGNVYDLEVYFTGDVCLPNPCNDPPAAFCDGDDLVTPLAFGACTPDGEDAFTCDYVTGATTVTCPGGCTDGACDEVPTVSVVSTSPDDDATDVAADAAVVVTFSAPMDAATLTAQTERGACAGAVQLSFDDFATCVPFATATAELSGDGSVATFTPDPALTYGLTYALKVTGGESATGATLEAEHNATFTTAAPVACGGPMVVISQVYGGGGNSGAIYTHDFVELHNRTAMPVTLDGWSVQYASSSGTYGSFASNIMPLTGVIPPGGYFLAQQASNAAVGVPLPTPDQEGDLALAGASGKAGLFYGADPVATTCPDATQAIDVVAYGGATNCEGRGRAGGLSSTTSAHRDIAGCVLTDDAGADFYVFAPAPRNSATPPAVCACSDDTVQNETDAALEADYCNLQHPPTLNVAAGEPTGNIYGQIFEAGLTDVTSGGPAPGILGQVGYGRVGSDPTEQAGWAFFPMTFNVESGNNDEYGGSFLAPVAPELSTYAYTTRFSLDGGASWTYCDKDGAGSNPDLSFDATELGLLTLGGDACSPNPCEGPTDPPFCGTDAEADVVFAYGTPGDCTIVDDDAECSYVAEASADCAATGDRCLNGACVDCLGDDDCEGPFSVCDADDNLCVAGCIDDIYEGNDTAATAEMLSEDLIASDLVLCPGGTSDFFAVNLAVGDTITATITFDHATSDLDLYLYDPDGDAVADSETFDDVETVTWTVGEGEEGVYLVEAFDWGEAGNTYDIIISFSGDPCLPNPCLSPGDAACDGDDLVTPAETGVCSSVGEMTSCDYDTNATTVTCAAGCLVIDDGPDVCETVTELEIDAVSPADTATDVAVDSDVVVTFNQAVNAATLTAQTEAGACTGGVQLSYDGGASCVGFTAGLAALTDGDTVATLTPATPLAYGVTYTLTVTTDVEGATNATLAAPAVTTFSTPAPIACGGPMVVISQVYGGGGNSGAFYRYDFVELHNRTTEALNLRGWNLQVGSASASSYTVTPLTGVVPPGGYYLVQQAAGNNEEAADLPTPDDIGTHGMGASSGKVLLVAGPALTGNCPSDDPSLVDRVNYGGGDCAEGSGATQSASATLSVHRVISGCVDSDDNAADFVRGEVTPRNTESPVAFCACEDETAQNGTGDALEADYCNLQWPHYGYAAAGATFDVYGRVFEAGVTNNAGEQAGITAQVGYGFVGSDPTTQQGWAFFPATFNTEDGDNDEYGGALIAPQGQPGDTFAFTTRFSLDDGASWTYCDKDGAGSNGDVSFDASALGLLTIGPPPCSSGDACTTPDADFCDGDQVKTYTTPGACSFDGLSPEPACEYTAADGANCVDSGQRCLAGACVDCLGDGDCDTGESCDSDTNTCVASVCDPNPCVRTPDIVCVDGTLVTEQATGTCDPTPSGELDYTCTYGEEIEVVCDDFCVDGACTSWRYPEVAGDLVITEYFANAAADAQWFEVHNPTADAINLFGLEVFDLGSDAFVVDEERIVPAGGYIVFGANDNPVVNGGVAVDFVWVNFTLVPDGDQIALGSAGGVDFDDIGWDATWPNEASAATALDVAVLAGAEPHVANDDEANWCLATSTFNDAGDLGTPGAQNGACGSVGPLDLDSTSPMEGAEVPVDAAIVLTFNQAMNGATLTAQTEAGACSGNVQLSYDGGATCVAFAAAEAVLSDGGTVATLTPSPALTYGLSYQLEVSADVTSATGETLGTLARVTFTTASPITADGAVVVISQVYGGGGNSGAPYTHDFVELYNRTDAPVTLDGWYLDYASSNGTTWTNRAALSGVIAAQGYYLVQLSAGSGNGVALPTPDLIGPSINLSGSSGNVVLSSHAAGLSGTCPTDGLIDRVGYGSGACFDGSGGTSTLNNENSAHRDVAGCLDSDDNANDFYRFAPNPRNGASPTHVCASAGDVAVNDTGVGSEADYCVLQHPPLIWAQAGGVETVYGQIYEDGVTTVGGQAPGVTAQLGWGPVGSDPRANPAWALVGTTFNTESGDNDEYQASFATPVAPDGSTYAYAYRFSLDDGATWTWCDVGGAGSNDGLSFDPADLGLLTIGPDPCDGACTETASCEGDVVQNHDASSCSSATGAAVCSYETSAGANCADTDQRCLDGTCVDCLGDDDCAGEAVCQLATNTCINPCEPTNPCTTPPATRCEGGNFVTPAAEGACSVDTDQTAACDYETGATTEVCAQACDDTAGCVECLTTDDCNEGFACNTDDFTCVAIASCDDDGNANNTAETALHLDGDTALTGLAICPAAPDYFSIDLALGETVLAGVIYAAEGGELFVRIYDDGGTLLASSDAGEEDPDVEWTAETAGTYIIEVIGEPSALVEATYDLDVIVIEPTGTTLWFSEYIEGSSNNKALEIFNAGAEPRDLSGCSVRGYNNGSASVNGGTFNLSGTLAPGGVYTLCHGTLSTSLAGWPVGYTCNQTASLGFNGDDDLELICDGVVQDVIGQIGVPLNYGTNKTLHRKCGVSAGDPIGNDAFAPDDEWDTLPSDTVNGLGRYYPIARNVTNGQELAIEAIDFSTQKVALRNVSGGEVTITSDWRFCQFPDYAAITGSDLVIPAGSSAIVDLPSGGGWNFGATDSFELAVYRDSNFGSAGSIAAYVAVNSSGFEREPFAVTAGVWTAGSQITVGAEARGFAVNEGAVANSGDAYTTFGPSCSVR